MNPPQATVLISSTPFTTNSAVTNDVCLSSYLLLQAADSVLILSVTTDVLPLLLSGRTLDATARVSGQMSPSIFHLSSVTCFAKEHGSVCSAPRAWLLTQNTHVPKDSQ